MTKESSRRNRGGIMTSNHQQKNLWRPLAPPPCHLEGVLGSFWGHLGVILGSFWCQSGGGVWERSLEENSGVGAQKCVPLSAKMQKFLFFVNFMVCF